MIQLQVLNYLLDKKDTSFLLINNITSDFFPDYSAEFNFIKTHIEKYGVVPDKETFLAVFPAFDLINVEESPDFLIDELYQNKNKRFLAQTFNNIRSLLINGDIDEAIKVYSTSQEHLSQAIHLDAVDVLEDTSRYDAYVERCTDFKKYYVKTGFKELDDVMGGWDRQEELATIVARPGVGKSWALLKCALAAAQQGLKVGIYSGEMSDRKVGYRLDTLISHISNHSILQGNIQIQNEYRKYIEHMHDNIPGSIKVLTPAMIDGPAGVTALRAFIEKENLDILCIDQHSLLEDDRKARNPVEKAANISKDLKNLQVLKKIPIIAVSQQNREATDTGVSTAHVAQSDRIAQDSTAVIFLEQKDNILTLQLVKSRDSVNGKRLQYAIDLDKGIFTYIPTETDGLKGSSCEEVKRQFDGDVDSGEDAF